MIPARSLFVRALMLLVPLLALLPAAVDAGLGGKLLGKGAGKLVSRSLGRGVTTQMGRTVTNQVVRTTTTGAVAGRVLGRSATHEAGGAATRILSRTGRSVTGSLDDVASRSVRKVSSKSGKAVTTKATGGSNVVASNGAGGGGSGVFGQGVGGEFPRGHWERVFADRGITPESNPVLFERLMRGRRAAWAKQRAAFTRSTRTATQGTGRAVAHTGTGPVPAPKTLAAFPGAARARPKTPVQGGGGLRKRWVDRKGKIYEWDSQHGTVEVYSRSGRHLGEFHARTGRQLKPADPTRSVEP